MGHGWSYGQPAKRVSGVIITCLFEGSNTQNKNTSIWKLYLYMIFTYNECTEVCITFIVPIIFWYINLPLVIHCNSIWTITFTQTCYKKLARLNCSTKYFLKRNYCLPFIHNTVFKAITTLQQDVEWVWKNTIWTSKQWTDTVCLAM